MQIIINAGGNGTRLWPISTKKTPKQFCSLVENRSLLQATFFRLVQAFPADRIWVNTNINHIDLVAQQLPALDRSHILTEPARRDTFPAVAAHAAVIAHHTGDDEPIIFISSDHYIAPQKSIENHNRALEIINQSLESEEFDITVVGIKPTFPSDRFGYIQVAKDQVKSCFEKVVKVDSFKEKPSIEVAESFLKDGNYLWNFGSFSFKFKNLKKILQQISPETLEPLEQIKKSGKISLENFEKLPKNSFDYAVLEKTKSLGMIGMELEIWDDIGSFDALCNYLDHLPHHDTLTGQNKVQRLQIAGSGNKVMSTNPGRKVAFVGVKDLVLIETEEGILVIDPKQAGQVKKIAEYFES